MNAADKTREAFEAWATSQGVSIKRVSERSNATYTNYETYLAYHAWNDAQAALHQFDLLQMLHECAEYIAALNGEQDDYCQRARALIARATGDK